MQQLLDDFRKMEAVGKREIERILEADTGVIDAQPSGSLPMVPSPSSMVTENFVAAASGTNYAKDQVSGNFVRSSEGDQDHGRDGGPQFSIAQHQSSAQLQYNSSYTQAGGPSLFSVESSVGKLLYS